jgi:integrase
MPRKAVKFPLRLHKTGQWTRKVRGRSHYFGTDKDLALKRWVEERDDLLAGRVPRPRDDKAVKLGAAVNAFLTFKRGRVDSGELTPGAWSEYFKLLGFAIEEIGPGRAVADLRPHDFEQLRAKAAKRWAVRELAKFITCTRGLFNYCFETELIAAPVRYGKVFDLPERKWVRLAREKRGEVFITAADLNRMMDAASVPFRAMLLLGINAAFNNADCSRLDRKAVDRESGWLSGLRPKTAVPRRCPLWPETVAALNAARMVRPDPKNPTDADAFFLTREGGRFVETTDRPGKTVSRRDQIGATFARVAQTCEIKLPSRFAVLRHTFRTVSDETLDRAAIERIMGHSPRGIDAHYIERISDERLVAVTEHVRRWLLDGPGRDVNVI